MKKRYRIIWGGGPELPSGFWDQFTGNIIWNGNGYFIVEYK